MPFSNFDYYDADTRVLTSFQTITRVFSILTFLEPETCTFFENKKCYQIIVKKLSISHPFRTGARW